MPPAVPPTQDATVSLQTFHHTLLTPGHPPSVSTGHLGYFLQADMACLLVPLFKVPLAAGGPGVGAVRPVAHQAMGLVTVALYPTMSTVKVMPGKG